MPIYEHFSECNSEVTTRQNDFLSIVAKTKIFVLLVGHICSLKPVGYGWQEIINLAKEIPSCIRRWISTGAPPRGRAARRTRKRVLALLSGPQAEHINLKTGLHFVKSQFVVLKGAESNATKVSFGFHEIWIHG